MKKVLVISCMPFSNSNRGIDMLSIAFKNIGYDVYHMVYPVQVNTKKFDNISEKEEFINQIYSSKLYFPYAEKYMWWLPKRITRIIIQQNVKKFNKVDFNNYDVIVLESGKPLWLIDQIPDNVNIIYRQSDSVKHILSRNKYMWELEDKTMKRANAILVVNDMFYDLVPNIYKTKTFVVVNGINIQSEIKNSINPYKVNFKNAIYLGYAAIDFKILQRCLIENKDIIFNIIGSCLSKKEVKKLKKYSNFNFLGVLSSKEYLPYIKHADIAIVPYKSNRASKFWGLTSKYILFMQYELPIISSKVGNMNEFKEIPIIFVDNEREFSNKLGKISNDLIKQKYDIDLKYYSKEERIREYKKVLLQVIKL